MMRVSVIVPVHNRFPLALRAIASLMAQDQLPGQIVVVDDGSESDFEPVLAAAFASICKTMGIDLCCIRHLAPLGPAAARNSGIATASGELLMFLDSDDVFHPEKIQSVIVAYDQYPADYLCHAFHWREGRHWTAALPFVRAVRIRRLYPMVRSYLSPSCFSITRDALSKLGSPLFDPDYRVLEDFELSIRLSRHLTGWFIFERWTYLLRPPQAAGGLSTDMKVFVAAMAALIRAYSPQLSGIERLLLKARLRRLERTRVAANPAVEINP